MTDNSLSAVFIIQSNLCWAFDGAKLYIIFVVFDHVMSQDLFVVNHVVIDVSMSLTLENL